MHPMVACVMHYNLDFGLVMRYLDGEYTAKWRDVDAILAAIGPYVSEDDKELSRVGMCGKNQQRIKRHTFAEAIILQSNLIGIWWKKL